jgi:acyl carrier protein
MNNKPDILLNQVKEWLLAKNPHVEDIDGDLDLLENRLLDSLQFVSFLMFLEEIREAEIEVEGLDFSLFQTLNQIKDNFLSN